jgi:peroxiredoxin Q/BCP
MAMIEPGQPFPQFQLMDQHDQPTSLDEFKGRWLVLYFYPKDNTSGCTIEAKDFTGRLSQFQQLGADIVGVSPDDSACHRDFIAAHELKVRLCSDPSHAVMERLGVWGKKLTYGKESVGVIRSTFLIDPQQRLAESWRNVKADGHAEKVLERLRALRAAALRAAP